MMDDLRPVLRLFARRKGWLLIGALLAVTSLLAGMGLLASAGWLLGGIAIAGTAGTMALAALPVGPAAGVRGFAVFRPLSRYAERLATHEATFRTLADLRIWLFRSVIPLAPARMGEARSGDLLARITGDVDALDGLYLRVLSPSLVALAVGLVALVVGFLLYWPVGIVLALAMLIAGVLVPIAAHRLGSSNGQRQAEIAASLRTRLIDGLRGMTTLKAFGADGRHRAAIKAESAALIATQTRMSALNGLGSALTTLVGGLGVGSVLLLSLHGYQQGSLSAPMVLALTLGAVAALEAIGPLAAAWQQMGRIRASARRVAEVTERKPATVDPERPAPLPVETDLCFDEIHFRYGDEGAAALSRVSLKIPAGGRVAVVGPSGSGKSSLISLALRFWDPQGGRVLLGGSDIRTLAQDDVRSRLAVVGQSAQLFTATLADNLRLADRDATDDRLWHALETARLADFVRAQPDGLDTWIGEGGVGLSGGQARRLTLARAYLKNAPILLLDEPTEGLDRNTEAEVLEALETVMAGRSVLTVTHRLQGLERMDRIVILDAGQIVESGSFDALMAAGGRFAALKAREA